MRDLLGGHRPRGLERRRAVDLDEMLRQPLDQRLQLSGLEYSWEAAGGDEIELPIVLVGGEILDPEARYDVVTVDYVAVSQPMNAASPR